MAGQRLRSAAPRRWRARAAGGVLLGLGLLGLGLGLALWAPGAAHAAKDSSDGAESAQGSVHVAAAERSSDVVDVVEVSGYLDGILADFIERSISKASDRGSLGLVLQVDSPRALINDQRFAELVRAIAVSETPVTMWVGPSGAVAKGAVGQLAGLVSDVALAPGSRIGDLGPPLVSPESFSEPFAEAYERMRVASISSEEAIELGVGREAPTLPFFVIDLPGFRTELDSSGDEPLRVPVSRVRFAKLSLLDQLMHAAASPALAYLLLSAGGVLLIFELYTAGVGLAGVAGALALMLGCYGLAALPARGWAVALLLVAAFGYCIDIQTGVPRVWTVIATVCFAAGSLTLFQAGSPGWVTLLAGIGGVPLALIAGMPTMVRARFSTPTIGREWMIGAVGTARQAVAPEGVVMIEDAPWRARTHRSTPIAPGGAVRVVAIEGLTIEVAPADVSDIPAADVDVSDIEAADAASSDVDVSGHEDSGGDGRAG